MCRRGGRFSKKTAAGTPGKAPSQLTFGRPNAILKGVVAAPLAAAPACRSYMGLASASTSRPQALSFRRRFCMSFDFSWSSRYCAAILALAFAVTVGCSAPANPDKGPSSGAQGAGQQPSAGGSTLNFGTPSSPVDAAGEPKPTPPEGPAPGPSASASSPVTLPPPEVLAPPPTAPATPKPSGSAARPAPGEIVPEAPVKPE